MKQSLIILALCLMGLNLHAQKGKSSKKNCQITATISNGKSKITSKSHSYSMVFPQLKERFDEKAAYILTKEGDKLKMADKTTTQWSWGCSQTGTVHLQPIPYGGSSVSTSVEFSNGGRDVTISTTITTDGSNGSSTSETKTTTIRADGSVERSTTTTNTQESPDDNPDVVVVVVN